MDPHIHQSLSHVLWLGGATDSGKTTLAQRLAGRFGLQCYRYDRTDLPHHERLAASLPTYRAFLDSSLDARWVYPEPHDLFQRALQTFQDRFPLVIEDLLCFPSEPQMIAEGFGLTPELIFPLLVDKRQALFLIPTEDFKRASMQRRSKPSFKEHTSNPQRAAANLLARDLLLAGHIQAQARQRGLTVYQVDACTSIEEVAAFIEQHFRPFLPGP